MSENLVAKATTTINASKSQVWTALTDPTLIKRYMFGTNVSSDWKVGNPITWKGEMKGVSYEDKGIILQFEPEKTLSYSHFSPLESKPNLPANYHNVIINLADSDGKTNVTLTQDNNSTEEAKQCSQENWIVMLKGLKEMLEA